MFVCDARDIVIDGAVRVRRTNDGVFRRILQTHGIKAMPWLPTPVDAGKVLVEGEGGGEARPQRALRQRFELGPVREHPCKLARERGREA